jgi:hypothetical protein
MPKAIYIPCIGNQRTIDLDTQSEVPNHIDGDFECIPLKVLPNKSYVVLYARLNRYDLPINIPLIRLIGSSRIIDILGESSFHGPVVVAQLNHYGVLEDLQVYLSQI